MNRKWKILIGVGTVIIFALAQQPVAQGPQAANAAAWLANISQIGGASLSIGTQTAANSIPVALPTATITTLTPPPAPVAESTSTYALTDFDLSATAATNVKASAGNVYGFYGFNPNTTTCYLQFYNSASASLGTSALHPFGVVTGGSFVYTSPIALANYSTAISTGETTTATGATPCSSAMIVTILYN